MDTDENKIDHIIERLTRMEASLEQLIKERSTKDYYTTAEIVQLLGRAEFTVREWCRLGRICAEKKGSGRSKFQAWVISRAELVRLEREGLLPEQSRQAKIV